MPSKKHKMTPFAKFFLIIAIVGGGAYFSAPYIQAYTNPDSANPPQNPFKFLTQKSAPKLNNKHVIYLHGLGQEGTIALRSRILSIQEYNRLSKDKRLNKNTYAETLKVGDLVALIQEHDNAYEIKTTSGRTGFIPKKYKNAPTLIKINE